MTVRVPTTGDPLVRELFELMNAERVMLKDAARRAGVEVGSITRWRAGKKVFMASFQAVLATMDYELVILPKAKPFTED